MGPPLPTSPIGRMMGSPSAPCVLGVFQDYTCPFSARLWKRLVADVVPKYVDAGETGRARERERAAAAG